VNSLMEKKDDEILVYLVCCSIQGVFDGSRALLYGFQAVNGKKTKSKIISAVADSLKSFVAIFPAVTALGIKQGERVRKFIEKVTLENARKREHANEISEETNEMRKFIEKVTLENARKREQANEISEETNELRKESFFAEKGESKVTKKTITKSEQLVEFRRIVGEKKERSKATTTKTKERNKILHFIQ